MNKKFYVYMMTNKNNTVIYTGVTNDLRRRVLEHKQKIIPGFTKLVYFEESENSLSAINREKLIKAGSRAKKEALINSINPKWNDLSQEF